MRPLSALVAVLALVVLAGCRTAPLRFEACQHQIVLTEAPADVVIEGVGAEGTVGVEIEPRGVWTTFAYAIDGDEVSLEIHRGGGVSTIVVTGFHASGRAEVGFGGPPDVDALFVRGADGDLTLELRVE